MATDVPAPLDRSLIEIEVFLRHTLARKSAHPVNSPSWNYLSGVVDGLRIALQKIQTGENHVLDLLSQEEKQNQFRQGFGRDPGGQIGPTH